MKTYRVAIIRSSFTYIDVEADNRDDAEDLAWQQYDGRIDAWGEHETFEIDEIGND